MEQTLADKLDADSGFVSEEAPWHGEQEKMAGQYDESSFPEQSVEATGLAKPVKGGHMVVADDGWILKITPKHECPLPTIANQIFVGSIWRCGGCGQHWQVFERRSEANRGEKAFKRVSEEVVAKRLSKGTASDEG